MSASVRRSRAGSCRVSRTLSFVLAWWAGALSPCRGTDSILGGARRRHGPGPAGGARRPPPAKSVISPSHLCRVWRAVLPTLPVPRRAVPLTGCTGRAATDAFLQRPGANQRLSLAMTRACTCDRELSASERAPPRLGRPPLAFSTIQWHGSVFVLAASSGVYLFRVSWGGSGRECYPATAESHPVRAEGRGREGTLCQTPRLCMAVSAGCVVSRRGSIVGDRRSSPAAPNTDQLPTEPSGRPPAMTLSVPNTLFAYTTPVGEHP